MALTTDIWYWPYELHSRSRLNSISQRQAFVGALIRVSNGFGCIHPWPELGDKPLPKQLEYLRKGQKTNLITQALLCASEDRHARSQNKSLYQIKQPLPTNHWLWKTGDSIDQIEKQGFDRVKLKIGPNNMPDVRLSDFHDTGIQLRLDANESFDLASILSWWQSLPHATQSNIEFIEDPIAWQPEKWAQLQSAGIPIAADREVYQRLGAAEWAVIKPATESVKIIERQQNILFTSYMDHPLGQVWAASQAQRYYQNNSGSQDCGLLTHHCFETNDFSEQLVVNNTMLNPPPGTGLGFDDLLEKLPWQRLS